MKVVTLIQARMSSSRLPQKIMLSLAGKPLLLRMYERVKQSEYAGEIVVITSRRKEDDQIAELCREENISIYRGHLTDLLDRHYKAAKKFNADAVVKIPSDCPLIDPQVIDRVIKYYSDQHYLYDYVSNLHPATYPDGNDVEIMSFKALEKAWQHAHKDFEREHTTPYIWERPELFRIGNIEWETELDYSSTYRWTIDYEEDYIFIRTVFEELYEEKPWFGLHEILELLESKPFLKSINRKYAGQYWYDNHLDELSHIDHFKNKYKKAGNE
ncbi:MAG: glycosyltransferase family protein [Melioribacteraceae bacterium]|nr:glycosyltransferase family protein [Melioribacteraceae bacterium]